MLDEDKPVICDDALCGDIERDRDRYDQALRLIARLRFGEMPPADIFNHARSIARAAVPNWRDDG